MPRRIVDHGGKLPRDIVMPTRDGDVIIFPEPFYAYAYHIGGRYTDRGPFAFSVHFANNAYNSILDSYQEHIEKFRVIGTMPDVYANFIIINGKRFKPYFEVESFRDPETKARYYFAQVRGFGSNVKRDGRMSGRRKLRKLMWHEARCHIQIRGLHFGLLADKLSNI